MTVKGMEEQSVSGREGGREGRKEGRTYVPKLVFMSSTIGRYPFMASPRALPMKCPSSMISSAARSFPNVC